MIRAARQGKKKKTEEERSIDRVMRGDQDGGRTGGLDQPEHRKQKHVLKGAGRVKSREARQAPHTNQSATLISFLAVEMERKQPMFRVFVSFPWILEDAFS